MICFVNQNETEKAINRELKKPNLSNFFSLRLLSIATSKTTACVKIIFRLNTRFKKQIELNLSELRQNLN